MSKPEVVVVGGGFAGLSAALQFGRCLTKAVVISEEAPRNRFTQGTHNFLTRDGTSPVEILKIAKEQLEKYSEYVTYVKDSVTDAAPKNAEGRFTIKTAKSGDFHPRWIIFATGMQDHLDKVGIKGLQECWGKTVFPCPFCDAFERKGRPLAIIGNMADGVSHYTRVIQHWTNDLIVFTDPGNVHQEKEKPLYDKKGIKIVTEKIAHLEHEDGKLKAIHTVDGKSYPREGAFLLSSEETFSDLPGKVGVKSGPMGAPETQGNAGKTDVPGVYIVGDLKDFFSGGIGAAAQGSTAAEMVVHEIVEEEFGKLEGGPFG